LKRVVLDFIGPDRRRTGRAAKKAAAKEDTVWPLIVRTPIVIDQAVATAGSFRRLKS